MDRTDLNRANVLSAELSTIEGALDRFDAGEQIRALSIGEFTVSTQGMTYPAQMVEAIKQAFMARQAEIEQELTNLGVTGMPAR